MAWNSFFPAFSLFFAFVPLLFIVQYNKGSIEVFNLSFIVFLIFHIATVWWLSNSSFIGFLIIISINSFFMATVVLLSFKTWKSFGYKMGIISFVMFWLTFEYIHYHWAFSWPFMNLGNWLGQIPVIVQWYEYTGVLGGTFWILIINVLVFYLAEKLISKNIKQAIWVLFILGFTFLIPLYLSKRLYNNYIEDGKEGKFKIIQPNINPYTEKYNSELFDHQINSMINLAIQEDSSSIDCYLFPESSFPVYLDEKALRNDSLMNQLSRQLVSSHEISVLGGLYSYQVVDNDTLFFNTAFMLNSNIQLYHKSKLVIGVEKMPFQEYLNFLKDLNIDFGGYNSSLTADNEHKVFYSNDSSLRIAPIICYESIYGQFVSEFINQGATSIAIITNDGWWGHTPALNQILMHAQLRAIETRKSVVRAANTGISCFINQKGSIVSQSKSWDRNYLYGSVFQNNKRTFYSRNGDFIGKISLYASIIFMLINLYTIIKERTSSK